MITDKMPSPPPCAAPSPPPPRGQGGGGILISMLRLSSCMPLLSVLHSLVTLNLLMQGDNGQRSPEPACQRVAAGRDQGGAAAPHCQVCPQLGLQPAGGPPAWPPPALLPQTALQDPAALPATAVGAAHLPRGVGGPAQPPAGIILSSTSPTSPPPPSMRFSLKLLLKTLLHYLPLPSEQPTFSEVWGDLLTACMYCPILNFLKMNPPPPVMQDDSTPLTSWPHRPRLFKALNLLRLVAAALHAHEE